MTSRSPDAVGTLANRVAARASPPRNVPTTRIPAATTVANLESYRSSVDLVRFEELEERGSAASARPGEGFIRGYPLLTLSVAIGTRLGPYEVVASLGAGGMGEVYRARDTRLGREVALKVLAGEIAVDSSRRARFEKEAQAASALAHPNIISVYDVGESEGTVWIAMELVDGRTVRDLLAAGALPVRRTLDLGVQIAEGLAAAHAAGIVHRDLKPENLILSKDGFLKILDFGLAKLDERTPSSEGPTVTAGAPKTEPGTVMGTVGYMSPEQAAGQALDFRTDQFSFGSILYEMATGNRAFQRKTGVETLAAILRDEPVPVAESNPAAPAPLRWIIERCLAKEPDDRFASTRDLARDLKSVRDHLSETSAGVPVAAAVRRGRGPWLFPALAALVAGLVAGAVGMRALFRPSTAAAPSFQRLTFRRGTIAGGRFAADGKTVVYAASWAGQPSEVYATQEGSPESRTLGIPRATILAISSTGELAVSLSRRYLVGFETVGTLARLPLNGGAPREVLERVTDADWSPDGQQFVVARPEGGQWQLEYPLGRVLASCPGWIDRPRLSPDGKRIAYAEHPQRGDQMGRVVVVDTSGKRLFQSGFDNSINGLAWSARGDEVWFSGAGIQALLPSGRIREVLRIAGPIELFDIARDGRVLIVESSLRREIRGVAPGESVERDLSWHDWSFPADLSADGRTLLFVEQGAAAGADGYLTYLRKTDGSPAILLGRMRGLSLSPDGRLVLAHGTTDPPPLLVLPTGAGSPRTLSTHGIAWQWGTWMPDSRHAVVQGSEPGRPSRLYVVDTESGAARPFSPEGVTLYGGSVSPDGKLVAAQDPERRPTLYSVKGDPPRLVPGMKEGEVIIRWSPDGQSLYVASPWSVPVGVDRLDVASGRREPVHRFVPEDAAGVINVGPALVSA
ncbi:MAG TPA: protein kinase, partial [Thermoanaerobaculia bacterium]